jgi:nicotinamidase-related amidase
MNPPKIDLTHTALVLIDLQKGIAGLPLAPYTGADVVSRAVKLADRFRAAKAPVVLVNVNFSPDFGDAVKVQTDVTMPSGDRPADWAEIVPELGPKPGDILITKRQWGAFYDTGLDLQLRRRGVRQIVLAGIATNYGVESTGRPAHEIGYQLILVEDAMSSRSAELHTFAVTHIFPRLGLVRSTEEVLAGCEKS